MNADGAARFAPLHGGVGVSLMGSLSAPDLTAAGYVEEDLGRQMRIVGGGASLSTLVNGLNALGVSPRDMISILQAIKAAGALNAELEVI